MNKTTDPSQTVISQGWSVHVYGSDRRLLCSLYPSHGWAFFVGIVLGFILALISLHSKIPVKSSVSSTSVPMEAPLNLD
jgi:hypothetical protein